MTKFVLAAGFSALLALFVAVPGSSAAGAQACTTPGQNTWGVTSTLVFRACFRVPSNRNFKRPKIVMTFKGDATAPDIKACQLRLHGKAISGSITLRPSGSDGHVSFPWPPMTSPANASVTCHPVSRVPGTGVRVLFYSAGRVRSALQLLGAGPRR